MNEKLTAESEIELHKVMNKNTVEIVGVMTRFFGKSFREIVRAGFDLSKLKTVQSVLEESHITSLVEQLAYLNKIQREFKSELPSISILSDFLELLRYLATSDSDKKESSSFKRSLKIIFGKKSK